MKFTRVRINNFYNLKDVDLDLTQGQALIVGPNGSGKTNIIKCVEFLVNRILGKDLPSGDIWDVNAPEPYIEVSAVLSKKEVEFFSNLRVFYLLCDVCEIISFICNTFRSLLHIHFEIFKPGSARPSAEELAYELQKQIEIFRGVPRETLTYLFEEKFFGEWNKVQGFRLNHRNYDTVDGFDACIRTLISKTIKKLFQGLLKINQKAMASDQARPADKPSDVLMSVFKAKTGIQGLDATDPM